MLSPLAPTPPPQAPVTKATAATPPADFKRMHVASAEQQRAVADICQVLMAWPTKTPKDLGTHTNSALTDAASLLQKTQHAVGQAQARQKDLLQKQSAALEKYKEHSALAYGIIKSTRALDDARTADLKGQIIAHPVDAQAAMELGETRFGRLSYVVEQTRKPLDQMQSIMKEDIDPTLHTLVALQQDMDAALAKQDQAIAVIMDAIKKLPVPDNHPSLQAERINHALDALKTQCTLLRNALPHS